MAKENEDLRKVADDIVSTLDMYFKNAGEAYDSDNLANLAINARSAVEQLCNLAFVQYTFGKDVTMKDKIDYLEKYKVILPEEALLFHKIRITGNAMVHGEGKIEYDIKNLYDDFLDNYKNIENEINIFIREENKPQTLSNCQDKYHKEYLFSDYVFGFSPKQSLIIDGEIMYVYSNNGGTININSISRIVFNEAGTFKSGNLYFYTNGGIVGVTWSTLKDNKKMNANANEIANYVKKTVNSKVNQTNSTSQVINNITSQISPADEVKKLKELLDMGVLTQEEFDKKKKELLGL